jgi:phage terminase large subunit-like protein
VATVDGYVADVTEGRIIAGSWTKKAVARFTAMRQRAAMDITCPYTWSPAHVDAVCGFVSQCPHVEGSWDSATITLQAWQVWMLAAIYGFRLKASGRRLVSVVYFQVARKSAKSTLSAALALYHLAVEREPGGQVVFAASTGSQARICFAIAQKMIRRSAWLRSLGFVSFVNSITLDDIGATMRPINARSSSQDGLNPSFCCLDESHAQSFELHDVLRSSQGARPDAMFLMPTTAGYDLTSVGYALRQMSTKVLDGTVESNHTFCVLYELDESDNWQDETVWQKAAPMLGTSPTLDYVRKYCADAISTPGLEGEFQVKIANRWAHSASSWISVAMWDKCADSSLRIEQFAGEKCWVGVDLSQRDDLTAVAAIFERDDVIYIFAKGYLPRPTIEARWKQVPWYRSWSESGDLVATDGSLIDLGVIEADIRRLCQQHAVQAITFDQYSSFQLAGRLEPDQLPALLEAKTAKTFTHASKEFEIRVAHQQLKHDGNALLRWCVSNAVVERRVDGSLLPKKSSANSPDKIDCLDAALFALASWLRRPVTVSHSLYDVPPEEFDVNSVWIG